MKQNLSSVSGILNQNPGSKVPNLLDNDNTEFLQSDMEVQLLSDNSVIEPSVAVKSKEYPLHSNENTSVFDLEQISDLNFKSKICTVSSPRSQTTIAINSNANTQIERVKKIEKSKGNKQNCSNTRKLNGYKPLTNSSKTILKTNQNITNTRYNHLNKQSTMATFESAPKRSLNSLASIDRLQTMKYSKHTKKVSFGQVKKPQTKKINNCFSRNRKNSTRMVDTKFQELIRFLKGIEKLETVDFCTEKDFIGKCALRVKQKLV